MEVSDLRREIEEAKGEEKRLRQAVQQASVDIGRRQKDIDNVMNERDILGTQLVRRNDELSLQYSRIKVRSLIVKSRSLVKPFLRTQLHHTVPL